VIDLAELAALIRRDAAEYEVADSRGASACGYFAAPGAAERRSWSVDGLTVSCRADRESMEALAARLERGYKRSVVGRMVSQRVRSPGPRRHSKWTDNDEHWYQTTVGMPTLYEWTEHGPSFFLVDTGIGRIKLILD